MAKIRNALDKHLGIPEQDYTPTFARYQALIEHVGHSLAEQNYAAAQVYALLIIAEQLDKRIDVNLTDGEDLAIGIAAHMRPYLDGIEKAIDRLER